MLISTSSLINRRRWGYQWRYLRGNTPWESGDTPAEVIDFIKERPPGKAIDIGCGTGKHTIALARHGWQTTGIDFAYAAIRAARARADGTGLPVDFVHADVTCPGCLAGPYDLALDIGCLFSLNGAERASYAGHLSRLLSAGAWYLLFAWLPRFVNGKPKGISPEAVDLLMQGHFTRFNVVRGEEKGVACAWYWYQRR